MIVPNSIAYGVEDARVEFDVTGVTVLLVPHVLEVVFEPPARVSKFTTTDVPPSTTQVILVICQPSLSGGIGIRPPDTKSTEVEATVRPHIFCSTGNTAGYELLVEVATRSWPF